ncbi:MAG TPA: nucleotidyltransferase domain-containing protein [Defluviitaleaceae bacterium]|nr:nucleotidyltransferase domain-containing protein [Defluviitaleaceae bacterium]
MVKKQASIEISIKKYIEALEQKIRVSKVILYGSWANGQPSKHSDIDLAVFSPDFGKNKIRELQLLSKLSWAVDESIEAIPYSVDKLNNPKPSTFVYEILQTGKTVYENPLN